MKTALPPIFLIAIVALIAQPVAGADKQKEQLKQEPHQLLQDLAKSKLEINAISPKITESQKRARTASMSAYEKLLKQLEQEVRQGNESKAKAIIEKLGQVPFHKDAKHELSESANFLIGKERWDLAKLFLERIPQSEPGWGYVLVKHLCSEAKNDATKLNGIDSWIKSRYPANPDYWCYLRITFGQETGRKEKVFEEFVKEVKDSPDDLDRLKRFIEVSKNWSESKDVKWITSVVNPKLAYDNYRVAEWLHLKYPTETIYYLKRSQSIPFTTKDEKAIRDYLRHHSAMAYLGPKDVSKDFSLWTRTMLAECYQKTGQSKAAQELLLQLSKETGGQRPTYALTQLAGQIQASTPAHPLENQIKKAQPENKDSIEYWRGRSDYYRGRGDAAKERDALNRALKIAKTKNDYSSKFYLPGLVYDYARFLRKSEGDKAALTYIWKEFDLNSELDFRKRMVRELAQQFETDQTHYLTPTDERLWQLLKQVDKWSYDEERMLWRMAKNASPEQRQTLWKRAEQLASGNASRESILGWIMNRTQEPKRSIPLLIAASESSDAEIKQNASFTLFESYLDVSDWKHAEKIWSAASHRLTDNEKPDWLSRIALAAARSGDKENAMRLWKSKDKVDLSAIGLLDDMKKHGMKEPLINYYRELKKTKPQSTVPDEALKILSNAG